MQTNAARPSFTSRHPLPNLRLNFQLDRSRLLRCAPDHLHNAAKLVWNDIVRGQARGLHISDSELEAAAVLLANHRDGVMPTPLIAQMNAALAELGLSQLARARLRD